ncbi:hypothetical protein RvY_06886 [Ramazzottius varieornatus]|uniref:G-protein coupled receptors family 1 profile domain-containing protein n=1 Tax=Ramazzottius varieornatus TaxID=947166 RepID=A0A1D1V6F4_RAMVA|nr:hypothetical protein RvY_06886 [Ramazzottius varieornatus]
MQPIARFCQQVIATVCSMPSLRTTGNYFIVNLSLADLLVTMVTQPSSILGRALFGEEWFDARPVVCSVVGTLCAMGCIASTWNICMISVNRYILICRYHVYSKIYTKRNTILLCLSVWILIYLIEMPNHIGWGDTRFSEVFFVCTFANHVHSFALFYILVGVMIPVSVSCAAYIGIFKRVRTSNLVRNRILNAAEAGKPQKGPSKDAKMTLGEFHRNVRVARVLFRVFVIFIVMWVPVAVLILMGMGKQVDYVWYILTVLLAHGNSSVNCVVYALSLDHFREGYATLLHINVSHKMKRNTVSLVDSTTRPRGCVSTVSGQIAPAGLKVVRALNQPSRPEPN